MIRSLFINVAGALARPALRLARWPISTMFHYVYYTSPDTWIQNKFLGYPILQNPLDLHLYQELIFDLKPGYIVQTGICHGGSIVYFANLLDLVGSRPESVIVGIDLALSEKAATITHPRARLIIGDSAAPKTFDEVRQILPPESNNCGPGMVILDSDHTCAHVLKELRMYSDLVTVGSYLIAEDTNANGRPVNWALGPGPYEAVEIFLKEDPRFVRDDAIWKRNLVSFHHHGWLKRIK